MTGAAAVAVACELRRLRDLAGWVPVAQRAESIAAALAGGEGVSAHEIGDIRLWAHRWGRLHPQLRAFYVACAPTNETASRALHWILTHAEGAKPARSLYYGLEAVFTEWAGKSPGIELIPQLKPTRIRS